MSMSFRTFLSICLLAWIGFGCQADEPVPTSDPPLQLSDSVPYSLDAAQASKFVALSLECTKKPWPNKPSHVYAVEGDLQAPSVVTPAFYGCFDWHSAVHGHWAMLRLLKKFPGMPEADRVRARLDENLSAHRLGREVVFFEQDRNKLFERPYGWGWYLRLYGEANDCSLAGCKRWAKELKPLADLLRGRMVEYLGKLSVPIRAGTHPNTAFALAHMLDAARSLGEAGFEGVIIKRARGFYLADKDCPVAYEPSGEDFVSGCLAEADLMRRVLPQGEFVAWLDGFLPPVGSERFLPLRTPVAVKDRHDPKIGHLIGLAFHRAWCFEGIASALPASDGRRADYGKLAGMHRQAGIEQMFDSGYGGSHWLASFAIYLLTGSGLNSSKR
jgi:hypothetical protein